MQPETDGQRIDQLQQAITKLEKRVEQLESGAVIRPQRAQPELETRVGLKLVNRVGVVTLVLGFAFLFRWAVESNWIGPAAQVFLGALLGLATLGLAELLSRKQQQVFAQGITATGLAILYFAAYAAYEIYKFIPKTNAFLLLYAVTALACWLTRRYASTLVGAAAVCAAFLVPLLLLGEKQILWRFIALSAALLFFYYFHWKNRYLLIGSGLVYYLLITVLLEPENRPALVITGVVLAACYFARRLEAAYYAAHLILLWAFTMQIVFWADIAVASPDRTSAITFALSLLYTLYGIALIGVGIFTRLASSRIAGLWLLGLVVAKLYLFDVWLLGRGYRISAFVALGALLIGASFLYSNFRQLLGKWWKA